MKSEVDTSILNSVNIKRFTKSVLEEYDAEINRSSNAKWEVTFPREIAKKLDREHGKLVFDAADRELGAGDLLVQPGTRVFSALLDLVQQDGSIGRLRLAEDTLQVNPPTVLQESALTVQKTGFHERTSDFALAFHFKIEFETPSSFHSEEMFSVTIDPETQTRLPDLTERLTSHLPQLLQEDNEYTTKTIPRQLIEEAYQEAQQAVIDQARPTVSELRKEADESASERIEEISDWYDQRRTELEKQIEEQEQEIRKWKKKRRNARKDSTRRKYIRNRKEAEKELKELEREVQRKKRELDEKESDEIDEVVERNEVEVDVSLLGITEVTYTRGMLELNLSSGHAEADVEISYLPATDDYQGLDCSVCSRDLTEGVLPRVCVNGHLTGDPCATSCRSCGLSYCNDCGGEDRFSACEVCWDDVCDSCAAPCASCGNTVCGEHSGVCESCGEIHCHLCGEECGSCEEFHCDTHLSHCADCAKFHCQKHTDSCGICGSIRCQSDLSQCSACNDVVCTNHSVSCDTCGDTLCEDHIEFCELCSEDSEDQRLGFCSKHTIKCSVGGEVVCSTHRVGRTIGAGDVCHNHRDTCDTCGIGYSETGLTEGRCTACQSIGEVPESNIPAEISSEFRTVEAGSNEAYMIILGKKLLGRNKVIIYDNYSDEEVDRQSAGMLKQLLGGFK